MIGVMGWCESDDHDLDDGKNEGDFYMFRGAIPGEDRFVFLCEEHRP